MPNRDPKSPLSEKNLKNLTEKMTNFLKEFDDYLNTEVPDDAKAVDKPIESPEDYDDYAMEARCKNYIAEESFGKDNFKMRNAFFLFNHYLPMAMEEIKKKEKNNETEKALLKSFTDISKLVSDAYNAAETEAKNEMESIGPANSKTQEVDFSGKKLASALLSFAEKVNGILDFDDHLTEPLGEDKEFKGARVEVKKQLNSLNGDTRDINEADSSSPEDLYYGEKAEASNAAYKRLNEKAPKLHSSLLQYAAALRKHSKGSDRYELAAFEVDKLAAELSQMLPELRKDHKIELAKEPKPAFVINRAPAPVPEKILVKTDFADYQEALDSLIRTANDIRNDSRTSDSEKENLWNNFLRSMNKVRIDIDAIVNDHKQEIEETGIRDFQKCIDRNYGSTIDSCIDSIEKAYNDLTLNTENPMALRLMKQTVSFAAGLVSLSEACKAEEKLASGKVPEYAKKIKNTRAASEAGKMQNSANPRPAGEPLRDQQRIQGYFKDLFKIFDASEAGKTQNSANLRPAGYSLNEQLKAADEFAKTKRSTVSGAERIQRELEDMLEGVNQLKEREEASLSNVENRVFDRAQKAFEELDQLNKSWSDTFAALCPEGQRPTNGELKLIKTELLKASEIFSRISSCMRSVLEVCKKYGADGDWLEDINGNLDFVKQCAGELDKTIKDSGPIIDSVISAEEEKHAGAEENMGDVAGEQPAENKEEPAKEEVKEQEAPEENREEPAEEEAKEADGQEVDNKENIVIEEPEENKEEPAIEEPAKEQPAAGDNKAENEKEQQDLENSIGTMQNKPEEYGDLESAGEEWLDNDQEQPAENKEEPVKEEVKEPDGKEADNKENIVIEEPAENKEEPAKEEAKKPDGQEIVLAQPADEVNNEQPSAEAGTPFEDNPKKAQITEEIRKLAQELGKTDSMLSKDSQEYKDLKAALNSFSKAPSGDTLQTIYDKAADYMENRKNKKKLSSRQQKRLAVMNKILNVRDEEKLNQAFKSSPLIGNEPEQIEFDDVHIELGKRVAEEVLQELATRLQEYPDKKVNGKNRHANGIVLQTDREEHNKKLAGIMKDETFIKTIYWHSKCTMQANEIDAKLIGELHNLYLKEKLKAEKTAKSQPAADKKLQAQSEPVQNAAKDNLI